MIDTTICSFDHDRIPRLFIGLWFDTISIELCDPVPQNVVNNHTVFYNSILNVNGNFKLKLGIVSFFPS